MTTVRKSGVAGKYYLLDAKGISLGRVASRAASLLRGKAEVDFTPHVSANNTVVVVNIAAIKFTGAKEEKKIYYHHSGYPGGLKQASLGTLLQEKPLEVMKKAVYGMLPKNRLRPGIMKKLKMFLATDHPYQGKEIKQVNLSI